MALGKGIATERMISLVETILILLGLAYLRTWFTQRSPRQKEFLAGKAFTELPDGFWPGSADFPTGSWRGKRFYGSEARGVNVFGDGAEMAERFVFKMYPAPGLWDTAHTVTRIDYNVKQNPFWLRPAVDEVVEVAPGKLLGKIHYRLFPGFSVAIEYFRQQKQ